MPRRADGVWVDSSGNVVPRTDPNDTGVDRSKATYKDGRWVDNATGWPIPNSNDLPARVPGTVAGAPGSSVWPDGTPVGSADAAEINNQANGNPPAPGATDYGVTGFADPSGATNNYLGATAPGAELNTSQPDAERRRMQGYLQQLQGQAQTGSGAWEGELSKSTDQARQSAQALGQSTPGVDSMAEMRNIGNAQAGVTQRGAGQAEILRQQTKQQAQQQLGDLYSAQASLDAQQAAEQAAARQGRREADQAITEQANKVNTGIYSGVAQGMATVAALSHGGPVPGKPRVFGDDSANDTVPAKLSPGEIVLPRSVTHALDPAQAAAAFVRAVKEHHGHHFDGGGQVPDPWATKPDDATGTAMPVLAHDSSVTPTGNAVGFLGIGTPQQAAGVRNGGLLDTSAYDQDRRDVWNNANDFALAYSGRGPSVALQAARNATDANLSEAMAAQANARGAGRGAAIENTAALAAEGGSQVAGKAADTVAAESAKGGLQLSTAMQRQRQMDLAFAQAQQQAAWRNSMLNSGIGLASQAQMRNILGGAGQGLATGAGALGKLGDSTPDANAGAGTDPWTQDSTASSQGDYGTDSGSSSSGGDYSTPTYAAHGGEIRDRSFVRALGYADGGEISTTPNPAAEDALIDQMLGKPASAPAQQLWNPQWTSTTADPPVATGPSTSPPGVVAQMAPAALPRPLPQAPARAPSSQAGAPRPDNYAIEQGAVAQEASANEEAGRARAEAAVGAQKAIEQAGIQQREQHARAKMASDADMARVLAARQEMTSIDTSVDPGRWWASRSTPGKIAAAIGLALGAIGAGNDGVNRAAGIIENSIGRDLEAQKAEHELKLKKGQMGIDSATSIYTLHRQLAQDDIAGTDAAKATALELAKAQVDVATARASSPLAKAQGQMLSAQLGQKRDEHDDAMKQRGTDNYIKMEDMKSRRIAALKESGGSNLAEKNFVSPGYQLLPGAAPKVEELAKWRDGLVEKKNTDAAIVKLKGLIDKSSLLPGTQDAAQAQSLIADLKVGYKNMAALGALSGSDYALIDAAIPDPTSLRGHITGDKTLKSRLDQFAKTADTKFHNRSQVFGIVKSDDAQPRNIGTRTATGKNGEKYRLSADESRWELVQ